MVFLIVPYSSSVLSSLISKLRQILPSEYDLKTFEFEFIIEGRDTKIKVIVVTLKEAWKKEKEYGEEWDVYDVGRAKESISKDKIIELFEKIVQTSILNDIAILVLTYSPFYIPWGPKLFNEYDVLIGFWFNKDIFTSKTEYLLIVRRLLPCIDIKLMEIPPTLNPKIMTTLRNRYSDHVIEVNGGYFVKCLK